MFDDLLMLDPKTGIATLRSRKDETKPESFNGHFVTYGGSHVCLYRWNDKLVFRLGESAYDVPADATAIVEEIGKSKTLRIVVGDSEICRWTYPKPETDIIDCLRYTDEEDSDFGLFVYNVINDKARQGRMYS